AQAEYHEHRHAQGDDVGHREPDRARRHPLNPARFGARVRRLLFCGVGAEGYRSDMVFQMMEAFHRVFLAMNEVSKPVVCVVDGIASAGGCELAAYCDIVVATENARFKQPEIRHGVFPPLGAVVYPRTIGPKRAMELLLTGDELTAERALMMGLVNRVVPKSALQETVDSMVKRISAQSGPVLQLLKKVIFEGTWRPFDEALKRSQNIYLNQLCALEDS